MVKRYTHTTFLECLAYINPDIEVLSSFTRVTDHIDVRCKRCGREWSPKGYSLLQGKGCPHCSAISGTNKNTGKTARKTQAQFEEELKQIAPTITVTGEYVNNKKKVTVRCNICNTEWTAVPNALLSGHGCPRCAKSGTSFMEQFILGSFRHVLGNDAVLSRDKSTIGMELDIVVPSRRFAVEPGSWFLHTKSINRDGIKREKCHAADIRLVTIYDQCPVDAKPPFDTDCILFRIDLNSGNHSELKELTVQLLNDIGETYQFSDQEWLEIETEAAETSRAQTHDDFVEKLAKKLPNIEVIGKFVNVNTRVNVRCLKCDNEWDAIPAQLLSGYGCRKCGTEKAHAKMRKSHNEYIEQMQNINPDIEIIGEYVGRHCKVDVHCKICGNEWSADAGSLLSGRGCPICGHKSAGRKNSKSHDEFIAQLFDVNPNIEVLGHYEKTHSKIKVRCKICKHEWDPEAGSLLAGEGCPVCGRKRAANSNKRKVACIETREVFPSAKDAARIIGVKSSSSIIQSIKKGCKSGGYHWRYAEDIDG